MSSPAADCESVQAVVCFRPPTIQDGEVQSAVQNHLLTAGARRLQRPARVVEPNIDALHEMTSYVDVVIFDEHELIGKLAVMHQLGNLLQHPLARLVAGMRLAGEYELYGSLGIIDHGRQIFDVCQKQVRPLVSGKATRKSDSEGIRAEHPAKSPQDFGRLIAAPRLLDEAVAHKFQKP